MIVVFTGADDLENEEISVNDFVESAPTALKGIIENAHCRFVALNNQGSMAQKRKQVNTFTRYKTILELISRLAD
jgi:hypothetical protein